MKTLALITLIAVSFGGILSAVAYNEADPNTRNSDQGQYVRYVTEQESANAEPVNKIADTSTKSVGCNTCHSWPGLIYEDTNGSTSSSGQSGSPQPGTH